MKIKKLKSITPSQRNLIRLTKTNISRKPILKKLICQLSKVSGRNNSGKIVVRHRGGGHKKSYRKIDFLRKFNGIGIITSIEYDPYRNSNIMSVFDFINNFYYYKLQPENLNVGCIVESGNNAKILNGHTLSLSKIPVGTFIHNISTSRIGPGIISRAAGAYSVLLEKNSTFCKIKLSSGEIKVISNKCYATIGIVSNRSFSQTTLGKAGRSRWLNRRPTVRGVAMNPIDHPHGGGEGKTSGGRKGSFSPWGKPIRSRKKK